MQKKHVTPQVQETQLSLEQPARSLVWDGDALVDWASGGQRVHLDGSFTPRHATYGPLFDAAVAAPGGQHVVIYTRLGTKGLVLHQGQQLREINRSYYHAQDYEYPIALLRTPEGRELLAHCPTHYNQLELEDLHTGERLTPAEGRKPVDFFQSRLSASACGRYLLSAGWVWHPLEQVQVYDVMQGLADARHLDGNGLAIDPWCDEGSSASFTPDGRLLVALSGVELDPEEDPPDTPTEQLRLYDLPSGAQRHMAPLQDTPGTIIAVGAHHVLALYQHPRLLDAHTGAVLQSWPHIDSGRQVSSILMMLNGKPLPPTAWDPTGQRLAVANGTRVDVLSFSND